ncbi:MAG: nucleotidyltransferase domain-containing protein [Candidatus Woesearchaeota archaeon]
MTQAKKVKKTSKKEIIAEICSDILEQNKTYNIRAEKEKIKKIISEIKKSITKQKIDADVLLGGSTAKDTIIGNDFDIDIFVRFNDKKYSDKNISELLHTIVAKVPHKDLQKVHGSRDYFQIDKRYEIIPVLKIKTPENAPNVTDASPLHVGWVTKQIKKNPSLKDEIRLMKLFLKGTGTYGAESYIKGFSGHVTDILVINYKTFTDTLKNIAKWKEQTVIDVEKHKSLAIIDKAKQTGPLIIIDPIQPNRNASASVSKEVYNTIKEKAQEFLDNPHKNFFEKPAITPEYIESLKKSYTCVLKVTVQKGKSDIIGARLLKAYEHIAKKLALWNVTEKTWRWDKEKEAYFAYSVKRTTIPKIYEQIGPTDEFKEHVVKFKKKYKKVTKKGKNYVAEVERKHTTVKEVLDEIKKDEYIKQKVKKISIIKP